MSTDLTFVTNEAGNNLRDRFNTLLTSDTRFFDCLVGYGSPARATPQIHEVLAPRLDIPAEAQCRVTINRNAVQLAYRYFPMVIVV